MKHFLVATGLGVAFSLTGASYAQAAEGDEPIGLFDENAESLEGQDVAVDSLGQIDITVKDLEIAKVLQLLSIQSQRNIVASRNVSGKVSADLYGVSFNEALEAILTPNGYGYEEKGNFIYVYTAAELEERQNAMRKTITKVVRLNYISSTDAAAFITPLLSGNGSITATGEPDAGFLPSQTDGGENSFAHADTLLIRDYEENVEEIETVLKELDVRPKQVLVEATILQATLTEQNAFGVDFSVVANFDALADFTNPLGVVDQMINGTNTGGGGTGVSSTVGNTATGNSGIKVGVTGSDASVFLRALDSVTDTTVLAKPNILVLNRQKADLLVGERLGYLSTTVTDTSETQTIEFLDVGTQLSVRPFVSEEGNIRLELRPSVSDGTTRLEGGFIIPDETTQELVTNIIVESGQTVVLGGLFVEDTQVG
ncbi:MAG: secretin N-terminal domain-containing protein, partial [Planctomycetota bacterium]